MDLWPLHHLLDRKATVNLAVTLFAETEVVVSAAKDSFALISEDQGLQVEGSFSQCGETTKLPLLGLLLKALWQPSWPGICIRTRAKSPAGAGLGGSSCLAVTVLAALSRARVGTAVERLELRGVPVAPPAAAVRCGRGSQLLAAQLVTAGSSRPASPIATVSSAVSPS